MQEQRVRTSVYKKLIAEMNKAGISEQQLVDACALPASEMSNMDYEVPDTI